MSNITKQQVIDYLQANSKNFDFEIYNAQVNPVAPGLKIALAEGNIKDALWSLERYHNPLADDLQGVGADLKQFRIRYKAANEARKAARAEISAPAVAQRELPVEQAAS